MNLGLSQITNDAEATIKFLEKYGQYFSKWFVTVADKNKQEYYKLSKAGLGDKLVLSYFKWIDDFSAARNANLETIDSLYWFWADSDDDIVDPERLNEIVRYMISSDTDVVQLKYDYAQNDQGQAISDHWRERVIRRKYEGKWDAPVHETFQGPPAAYERIEYVMVKHDKAKLDIKASMARNEQILRKHFEATKDPRDAFYLGMTELARHNYAECIRFFLQHIQTSGSKEDMYRCWCRIADAEWLRNNIDQALYATDEAIKLRPAFPDAYYIKVMCYAKNEQFENGIEWLKVAIAKPVPDTLHMIDPTLYKYRGLSYGALCYLFSGRVKEAFRLYKEVMSNDPSDDIFSPETQELFETAYFDGKAIDYTKWLLHYLKGNNGKPLKIFEALPERIFADPRLNAERVKFMPNKQWPDKSLVIYCGPSTESWGPDTLTKGMGGSEEAVVYLSRELAKLGWQVTIFNDREEEYWDSLNTAEILDSDKEFMKKWEMGETEGVGVSYQPWTLLNPYDDFDVFCAWRAPSFTRGIKARKKIIDLHDTPVGTMQITNSDIESTDLFMFKSKFQTTYAPNIPSDKIAIIPNGLVVEQFKTKQPTRGKAKAL